MGTLDKNAPARSVNATYLDPATPAIARLLSAPNGADGPDDAVLHAIHRAPPGSGYVPLAVKDGGIEWRELGALQIGQPMLPGMLAALAEDGYFGLSSSYRTGRKFTRTTRERWEPIKGEWPENPWPGKSGAARAFERDLIRTGPAELRTVEVTIEKPNTLGLPWQHYDTSTLRWLNVAYCDIDCYKAGLEVGEAVGKIITLQDLGEIPPATLLARSGRGLWAFWFLIDEKNPASGQATIYGQVHEPHTPQRASARATALYARVQRAIADKLTPIGADLAALGPVRYAPFPGTRKSKSGNTVLYWPQVTQHGLPAYTLRDLGHHLGLELRTREHPIIEAVLSLPDDADSQAKRKARALKGWRGRWAVLLRDLEMLLRLRNNTFNGAGHDGVSRNISAFYYAAALRRSGMSLSDVTARVGELGARCGLTRDEIAHAIKQAVRTRGRDLLSHARVRRDLRVTETEATYLSGRTPTPASSRKDDIAARHAAIRQVIDEHGGNAPSTRRMVTLLEERGIRSGNHTTVFQDYKRLGVKPLARAGRPAKLPGL